MAWFIRSIWILMLSSVFSMALWARSAETPVGLAYCFQLDRGSSFDYDGPPEDVFGYDGVDVRNANERTSQSVNTHPLFATFAEFLAAKTGATAAEDVTYLYQKVGAQGEHLKFGITKNPATRYTQEELGGGQLRVLTEGTRKDMLQLERNLHETLPIGPEEAQKFYIQKQIEKGLKPPPYNP